MRIILSIYALNLTVLLICQDPTRWIGNTGNLPELLKLLMPVSHLLSFALLSLLTFTACLPLPRWGMLVLLAIYGGAMELIQLMIPRRQADWMDWLQDLGGIIAGFIFFSLAVFFARAMQREKGISAISSS